MPEELMLGAVSLDKSMFTQNLGLSSYGYLLKELI